MNRTTRVPGYRFRRASETAFIIHLDWGRSCESERFEARFGRAPFVLDEATAFALIKRNHDAANERFSTLRALSRYLASVEAYNTRNFESMASLFGVSLVAMAIRLEELGFVAR
ncbi:hypothetical protein ACVWWJ_001788 [Luteibacter sp. HA06]